MNERLFIAIPVRLDNYPAIIETFSPLLQGRWRETSTLHVTLAFLGNRFTPEEIIRKTEGVEWTFEPSAPERFGYFPNSRVFVALCANRSLQNLRDRLETALGLEHQILNPHITLMRVKTITDTERFKSLIDTSALKPAGELTKEVVLYRSILSGEGARYEPLFRWYHANTSRT